MAEPDKPLDRTHRLAAYYDRLAGVYGEGEVFGARRAAVLATVATEVAQAHVVLDLGCGNGTYAAEIAVRVPAAQVVGADLSPEMAHAAHARLGARAAVVRANATVLPFRSRSFDLIFMSHVLQLIDDVEGCIAEIARCLAPGGLWVSTIGLSGWRKTISDLLGADALQELGALVASGRAHGPTDDKERVAAACAQVGLQPLWRSAPFSITWPAFHEWLRIRWFPVVDEAARTRAEAWLERMRPRAEGLTLSVAETLVVARTA